MPHKTMSYGDGSSLKAKPPRKSKPKPKPRRAPTKANKPPKPKPKVLTPMPKAKGRTTHTGSITQLGKGTRSQLRAIGYLETPATPKPRK